MICEDTFSQHSYIQARSVVLAQIGLIAPEDLTHCPRQPINNQYQTEFTCVSQTTAGECHWKSLYKTLCSDKPRDSLLSLIELELGGGLARSIRDSTTRNDFENQQKPQTPQSSASLFSLQSQPSLVHAISSRPFQSIRLHVTSTSKIHELPSRTGRPVAPQRERLPMTTPVQIYNTPKLKDDFYLNLLDWSSKGLLAVGVDSDIVMWRLDVTSEAQQSRPTDSPPCVPIPQDAIRLPGLNSREANSKAAAVVSSLAWSSFHGSSHCLAVGRESGLIELWDAKTQQLIRSYDNHDQRVGVMDWFCPNVLSSGCRDKSIVHRDIRMPDDAIFKWEKHKQEVCGLVWCPSSIGIAEGIMASGGNDNNVFVWQLGYDQPIVKLKDHNAAVKALCWCPYSRGILATGAGTNDRCIRLWDVRETVASMDDANPPTPSHSGRQSTNPVLGKLLTTIETKSQICNLMWSKSTQQLLSTHGFTHNQIIIWDSNFDHGGLSLEPSSSLARQSRLSQVPSSVDVPQRAFNGRPQSGPFVHSNASVPDTRAGCRLLKRCYFVGHTARVLYATMNSNGDMIATGGGDSNVCIWTLFPPKKSRYEKHQRHWLS